MVYLGFWVAWTQRSSSNINQLGDPGMDGFLPLAVLSGYRAVTNRWARRFTVTCLMIPLTAVVFRRSAREQVYWGSNARSTYDAFMYIMSEEIQKYK